MASEIRNKPDEVREYAKKIGNLVNESVPVANGTSEVSNDGLTAHYSDKILDYLDEDMKKKFHSLFRNTKEKMNEVAEAFEKADKNASV